MARNALLACLCSMMAVQASDTVGDTSLPGDDAEIPQSLKTDVFEPLIASSPFTRSLGVSDSLILTGIAHIDKHVVATVLDTKTMETQVVSQAPNQEGWQLVEIGGDPANSHTWRARIQVRGGAVVSVRYQTPPAKRSRTSSSGSVLSDGPGSSSAVPSARLVEEAKKAAVNYREGFSGDGYPKQPPPEIVEKLSRLSVGQREEINQKMIGLFSRGMAQDERRRIYDDLVNRASQGRR